MFRRCLLTVIAALMIHQAYAELDTVLLYKIASSRASSLDADPINWSRDSTPDVFRKYRLYISELELQVGRLMATYYYEDDWLEHGPQHIQWAACELAIMDYPGKTVRGVSRMEGDILRSQISQLETRIVTIAEKVFGENNDQAGYDKWLARWNQRGQSLKEGY